MADWIDVAPLDNFPTNSRKFVDVGGAHIAVFKIDNDFYAIESLCTHAMYELDDAEVDGAEITCPLHGARFSLRTGEALSAPAYEALNTFPVRVEDGIVQILGT